LSEFAPKLVAATPDAACSRRRRSAPSTRQSKGGFHHIRINPKLYRALSDLAAEQDMRISVLVTLLLNAGLEYRTYQLRLRGGDR
jgi:hypothetical protein